MADLAKGQENFDFSSSAASPKDSDTEVVIHRDVLDSWSNPDDRISTELEKKTEHGFENLVNTLSVEEQDHIESVEYAAGVDEKYENKEGIVKRVLLDFEEGVQHEDTITSVGFDNDEKTQEIEFRHRFSQQEEQQYQAQQKQLQRQERVGYSNEDTRIPKSNFQSLKTMESEMRSYQKDPHGDVPQITKASSEEKLHDGLKKLSFMRYFTAEVFSGKLMELEEEKYTERRQKVYTFMKIPREFEKLMVFGFMLCLDCFLFMFTFLPVRLVVALYKIITGLLFCRTIDSCDLLVASDPCGLFSVVSHRPWTISHQTLCHLQHIADRLFSSVGQDILDALFWTATEPRDRRREHIGIIPHFAMAVVYLFALILLVFHAVLVLFQAICLNVAVNSHNKALLVIMVSNQFVELKGSVFKRFEKNNLFQMACSDIRERFYYIVLVVIVTLRNLTEFNWNAATQYVKQKQDLETNNRQHSNQASTQKLKTQASVTLLDSGQSSSTSLVGEKQDTGPRRAGEQTNQRAKTLAEIDRYTLCSKEIVVF
ncbi:hypothetical protein pdam_00007186 [Pocillopora damicornis]|uniref:Uncharacterized protein n=1 Tax=Pocillopora damicornis TaxID=46731 RepID=A0A3M6USH3_POCDA|nr:hypothetical protein pdam_00007186 [Pocillopora damicornis]